jgi:hypothetical protein
VTNAAHPTALGRAATWSDDPHVEDTEYGPALVVDIKSLYYAKQKTRKKNGQEQADAAAGQQPKA